MNDSITYTKYACDVAVQIYKYGNDDLLVGWAKIVDNIKYKKLNNIGLITLGVGIGTGITAAIFKSAPKIKERLKQIRLKKENKKGETNV